MIAIFQRFGLFAAALCGWAAPAAACTVASPATVSLGSYSPNAIKASAVPVIERAGGINCSNSTITLLGGNVLTATISNANSFKLTSAGQPDGAYQVFPSATSTTAMASGVATNFLNPAVIDVLGLLGGSPSNIPLFIKPTSTTLLTPGTYSGAFRVTWAWKFCSGVWVGSSCTLGTLDQGSQFADIPFTITVAPKPVTVAIGSVTTWDPISGTSFPKAIIGAKKMMTVVVANPDIVATDLNSVRVEIPTQAKTSIALEGDGASSGAAIKFTDGTPSSTLAFSYTSAGDGADDVDFYADGTGWAYVPTPGDAVSQGLVTKVRLKPRGKLAAGSSFTITLPYLVR
ncbi:spore coat protein U domain-containing protein [Sphingomonas sp. MMS12-HWE2-04]|uniref:spore coat protein U domain-containing protein n=1 Tax=Sphingomonas sp. MMS12-HWE2-04 TaxID=3234199 RepID=UPI00384C669F